MKRIALTIILSFALGLGILAYADITDVLNQTWTEKEQRQAAFTIKAKLQHATDTVDETITQIQVIIDSGQFNTLPADLKVILNRWLNLYKDLRADIIADTEIIDIYQWRP